MEATRVCLRPTVKRETEEIFVYIIKLKCYHLNLPLLASIPSEDPKYSAYLYDENDKKGRNPLEIKEDKNEEEKEEENNINLEELKLGKKIICPEENCFSNAIISIDPVSFKVKSDCGKHKRKLNIIFTLVFSIILENLIYYIYNWKYVNVLSKNFYCMRD